MSLSAATRSRVARDHAILAPESHVPCGLPGWKDASIIVLISPQLGAGFTQYLADFEPGGVAGPPQDGVQRLFYVTEGTLELTTDGGTHHVSAGAFAYIPAGLRHQLRASGKTRALAFEKIYVAADGLDERPRLRVGHTKDVPGEPFLGDPDAILKTLLPDELAWDMAVNLFTFQPGATLPLVEVHVMEHGLTFLEGQGVYRLGDSWYPVQEGDSIWMAPYLPQWFCAIGKTPTSYIYYKDMNRDALVEARRG